MRIHHKAKTMNNRTHTASKKYNVNKNLLTKNVNNHVRTDFEFQVDHISYLVMFRCALWRRTPQVYEYVDAGEDTLLLGKVNPVSYIMGSSKIECEIRVIHKQYEWSQSIK